MIENALVAVIVLGAMGFVLWGLKRAAGDKAGPGGCSCTSAETCPLANSCDQAASSGKRPGSET